MAEKKKVTTTAQVPKIEQSLTPSTDSLELSVASRETVCVVCGHVNKSDSLICEMCSNYLFD